MAAEVIQNSKALKLSVQTGVNPSGNPTYSTRTISNINIAATNDDLLNLGQALGGLLEYALDEVKVATTEVLGEA